MYNTYLKYIGCRAFSLVMDNIEHNIELNFRKVCDDIALREKHPNSVRLVGLRHAYI